MDLRGFHLPEVGGHDAEDKHDFRDILAGGQAQGRGGRRNNGVLHGAYIVVNDPVGLSAEVGLVDDFVIALDIVGSGNDLIQPQGGGQGVPPVEEGEGGGGIVGDAGEVIADSLSRHDLGVAPFVDGDIGVQSLVGHGQTDDLAGKLNLRLHGRLVQAVELGALGLHDLVAAQGQGAGAGEAILIGADGIH